MAIRNALSELLALAGLDEALSGRVEFSGADPVFPTPYRIGTAGAAVLGAVGLAASSLWFLRTGRNQDVRVGVRAPSRCRPATGRSPACGSSI